MFVIKMKKIKKIFLGNRSTDVAFRYLPLVDLLTKNKLRDKKILEVGSGDYGITSYFKAPIVGVDVAFLEKEKNRMIEKIRYDGSIMPFADNDFDLVISVDCLEHIDPVNRLLAIKEMTRVVKENLVLVFPTGNRSYESDKRLASYFKKVNGYQDKFFIEHLDNNLPDVANVKKMICEAAFFYGKNITFQEEKKMLNVKIREFFMHCHISKNYFFKSIYYLGMLLLPFRNYLNFGSCYRVLLHARISEKDV